MSKSDDHVRYKADQLISQRQVQYYYIPGDEAMYIIHDTYSLGYRWDLLYSYENDSDHVYEKKIKTVTETKVTSSDKNEISANIKLEMKGVGFGIGGSHVTLTERELTERREEEETITVPVRSSVFQYQKVLMFLVRTWFINDAWGERWRVGGYGNYEPCAVESTVDVATSSFTRRPAGLSGTAWVSVEGVSPHVNYYKTRKFENCSWMCKRAILRMGIKPPRR